MHLDDENVESRSLSCRGIVQVDGIDVVPCSRIQAIDERLNGGDGFRGREGTVPRAIDKRAAQKFSVVRFIDNVLVGAFVLNHNQAIAFGVHGQDRNVNFAVENYIPLEVVDGLAIGADSRGIVQRVQIGVEIEAGLLVERTHLVAADRAIQLSPVIDSRVPGDIALCACLEFRTKRKCKWKVHLLVPLELIDLLPGEIVCGGLRRQWSEPSRQVAQGSASAIRALP